MTDVGLKCRKCRKPVAMQNQAQAARVRKERGLSDREWPKDVAVLFLCPQHGLIELAQVTFQ